MMLGAVLGYTFGIKLGWPMPLAVIAALSACALFGLVLERVLIRPFVARGSNAWLMAMVAAGIVLDNAVLFTFGKEPRGFPSALASQPMKIFGTGVYPLQLVIPLVSLGIAFVLNLVLHNTRSGRRCWRFKI
jgi:branched-chain amino acid transport system permease protein